VHLRSVNAIGFLIAVQLRGARTPASLEPTCRDPVKSAYEATECGVATCDVEADESHIGSGTGG
jgi:hypothetical protein